MNWLLDPLCKIICNIEIRQTHEIFLIKILKKFSRLLLLLFMIFWNIPITLPKKQMVVEFWKNSDQNISPKKQTVFTIETTLTMDRQWYHSERLLAGLYRWNALIRPLRSCKTSRCLSNGPSLWHHWRTKVNTVHHWPFTLYFFAVLTWNQGPIPFQIQTLELIKFGLQSIDLGSKSIRINSVLGLFN